MLLAGAGNSFAQSKTFVFQVGDLLFQQSDCGSFCEAINKVTDGINGLDFSHVGIVQMKDDKIVVLEAIRTGVTETPIDEFLDRNKDRFGNPLVVVGRLKPEFQHSVLTIEEESNNYLGKKYDRVFDINSDTYYCSELVYLLYHDANGQSLFELAPMTFKDPETKKTFEIWVDYYNELNEEIPEGKPGLNPGSISRSDKLEIYFPFSSFKE